MRRNILHPGAGELKYEIREIVPFARSLSRWNIPIHWENIGDPVKKGEPIEPWIKGIVQEKAGDSLSYAYTETEGAIEAREFLAEQAAARLGLDGAAPGTAGNAAIGPEDILFFNGLGDAIVQIFGHLRREARILVPSPSYSTFSTVEAAHSGYERISYQLDPARGWAPDMAEVELMVKYNDSIAGILIINPDNPTGAVYPKETLEEFVRIARRYGLFLICDETYINIVYGGARTAPLSQVIGDVPGIVLRSLSKEVPWPGARCGWAEIYNRKEDSEFDGFIRSLVEAKRLEVCSTSLPQLCIPSILGDKRYPGHLARRAAMFEGRALEAWEAFQGIPGVSLHPTRGAFYATVVFAPGLLGDGLPGEGLLGEGFPGEGLPGEGLPGEGRPWVGFAGGDCPSLADHVRQATGQAARDKRFVYWLLAATGICVVPLSGFASGLEGFRFTLLEHDDAKRRWIFKALAEAVGEYVESAKKILAS